MDRRIILLLSWFCVSAVLTAQTVDTLFYGNTKILYKNPYGSGYIAGTNGYGDIGKYQRFDLLEEVHVVGAQFWMALKGVRNTADSITVVFRKTAYGPDNYDSTTGGPGALIASVKTTLDAFDTTKGSAFHLTTPFNVNGGPFSPESLFVGIEWSPAADDSFALYADSAGQGENADRAWEHLTGVSYRFQRFNEPSDFSWTLDADLWIALLYKKGLLSVEQHAVVPGTFALAQNYPNPFNPSTGIDFAVPAAGRVVLSVYDILGTPVAVLVDRSLDAGRYTATFRAAAFPSGVYFYRLQAGGHSLTKRMLLVK